MCSATFCSLKQRTCYLELLGIHPGLLCMQAMCSSFTLLFSSPVYPFHSPSGWRETSDLILPQILRPDWLLEIWVEAHSAVHSHGNVTIKVHHYALCATVTRSDASEWGGAFIYLLLRLYTTYSFGLRAFERRVVLCVWNVTCWVKLWLLNSRKLVILFHG